VGARVKVRVKVKVKVKVRVKVRVRVGVGLGDLFSVEAMGDDTASLSWAPETEKMGSLVSEDILPSMLCLRFLSGDGVGLCAIPVAVLMLFTCMLFC
jgi:hypothetical protein